MDATEVGVFLRDGANRPYKVAEPRCSVMMLVGGTEWEAPQPCARLDL